MTDIYDPKGFVRLSDFVPDALMEMRYATAFNFVGEIIDGYNLPVALLTRETAEKVRDAADEFRETGYVIRVFDAYRPQRATDRFLRWMHDAGDVRMKPLYYPDIDKADLIRADFIGPRSAHSRGSAIDMTLVARDTGRELDMGSPFDFFGRISGACCTDGLTGAQIENRRMLRDVMLRHGFVPLDSEWWHFRLKDEPYPDTCFDFPIDAETLMHITTKMPSGT